MFLLPQSSRGSKERATGLDDHPKCPLCTESASSAAAKHADRTTNVPKKMLKYTSRHCVNVTEQRANPRAKNLF